MPKLRIDRLVVERGLAPTREKARRLVLAGEVLVNDSPVAKPGTLVARDAATRLRHPPSPYVGRGGEKLAGALADLRLDVSGLHVLDVGASTGGFTDCLLQRGVADVTALDVGKAQLNWKLRTDSRVRLMEGVNARNIERKDFPDPFDMATIDVSFISLGKILPAVAKLIREDGRILALVKPQFELTREDVESGGIVRNPDNHLRAITQVMEAARASGLAVEDVVASRLRGVEGNREFFLSLRPGATNEASFDELQQRAKHACEPE